MDEWDEYENVSTEQYEDSESPAEPAQPIMKLYAYDNNLRVLDEAIETEILDFQDALQEVVGYGIKRADYAGGEISVLTLDKRIALQFKNYGTVNFEGGEHRAEIDDLGAFVGLLHSMLPQGTGPELAHDFVKRAVIGHMDKIFSGRKFNEKFHKSAFDEVKLPDLIGEHELAKGIKMALY